MLFYINILLSLAFSYFQLLIFYRYVYLLPIKTGKDFHNRHEKNIMFQKYQFIPVLADVRNFWRESIRVILP